MKQIIEITLTIDNLQAAIKLLDQDNLTITQKIILNENRYKLADLKSYSEILLKSLELSLKNDSSVNQ